MTCCNEKPAKAPERATTTVFIRVLIYRNGSIGLTSFPSADIAKQIAPDNNVFAAVVVPLTYASPVPSFPVTVAEPVVA